tara:strand:- start:411 stop:887 length:477 start_codon:yes stop_codon:yes gene_type:complete
MDKFFVTFFFIGYIKFAPGTLGSLCGILTFYYFYNLFSVNPLYLFFLISFFFILGWYFTFTYVHNNKIHDPSEIIIDEYIGQLISLIPLLFLSKFESKLDYFLELLIFSFLLFRFFDILKPWPINIIDKSKSSLSIIMDDIVAGLFSAIIMCIFLLWL